MSAYSWAMAAAYRICLVRVQRPFQYENFILTSVIDSFHRRTLTRFQRRWFAIIVLGLVEGSQLLFVQLVSIFCLPVLMRPLLIPKSPSAAAIDFVLLRELCAKEHRPIIPII